MLQTLQEYEANVQAFVSNYQSLTDLGIQVDQLVKSYNIRTVS